MVARTRRPDGDAELVQEQLDRPGTEPAGSAGVHASSVSTNTPHASAQAASSPSGRVLPIPRSPASASAAERPLSEPGERVGERCRAFQRAQRNWGASRDHLRSPRAYLRRHPPRKSGYWPRDVGPSTRCQAAPCPASCSTTATRRTNRCAVRRVQNETSSRGGDVRKKPPAVATPSPSSATCATPGGVAERNSDSRAPRDPSSAARPAAARGRRSDLGLDQHPDRVSVAAMSWSRSPLWCVSRNSVRQDPAQSGPRSSIRDNPRRAPFAPALRLLPTIEGKYLWLSLRERSVKGGWDADRT